MDDVDKLTDTPTESSYRHVSETLRIVRQTLADELPVLVFAGAPFTLATYQIGTGKDVAATRRFIQNQPNVWQQLLAKISRATVTFLKSLQDQGAAAYQLFDSWAGALSLEEYQVHAHPYHQQIFAEAGGLSILFVKDSPYLDLQASSGAKVLSLGAKEKIGDLKARFPSLVFQGNVDHRELVTGTAESVQASTRECLTSGGGHRHILNLDHGMDRNAKMENFAAFVETATKR
jgi:uroporphyrinogen decarboxylase